MINYLKTLFKKQPPIGKYIDYPTYVMEWRKDWADRVEIVDYDRTRDKVKLRLLSPEEIKERENREYTI